MLYKNSDERTTATSNLAKDMGRKSDNLHMLTLLLHFFNLSGHLNI